MTKIIFLTGSIAPRTGGELYNYQLTQYLSKNKIDHIVVSLYQYRYLIHLDKIPILGDLLVSFILALLLLPYQGILVEDHYYSRYLFITNLWQKLIRKAPIITLVHLFENYESHDRFFLRRWFFALGEKFHLAFTNLIITSSDYSAREIQSLGFSSDSIKVLYPGIDRAKFIKLPRREDDGNLHKILSVANFIPRKGGLDLICAFALIKDLGFTLHLVGNKDTNAIYYNKMIEKTKELGLENLVYFYDGKDQENIKYLYSTADIFVLPSFKETFGIVLIEAMYYQLPIVTLNTSAMPDLVKDGENGFLVPPHDHQAMAEALKTLINQPELRTQMGAKGYQKVSESFQWEKTAQDFLNLIL